MAVKRNLESEIRAAQQYAASRGGKLPSLTDPKERAAVYRMAYPPSGGLPAELQGTVDESLYSAGISQPTADPLPQTVGASNLQRLKDNVDTAAAGVEKTSQPNEALRVLQEAIRAKSGVMDQPLGRSKPFEEAGLTGMGSLSAALSSQTQKFQDDYVKFNNAISQMSGTYKDMATAAYNNYNIAYTAYRDEADRIQRIIDDIRDHEQAIQTMNQQYQNSLKLEDYKRQHPGITEVIAGQDAGLIQNSDGDWVTPIDTFFVSPSGDTYDVAKYAQLDDGTPNPEHIANMRDAAQKMKTMFPETDGKMTSPEDIDKFIQQYYPGSPITSTEVVNAAGKYGIDWETILATMAAETQMGTDGSKGSQQYNFGNVGNTNQAMKDGKPVGMGSIQAGVDAVARTMGLPYYKRNQSTVNQAGEIPPAIELQITKMVTDITKGKGDTAYKNAVAENARKMYREGKTMDDIQDMLRYANQSTAMSGTYRDAASAVGVQMSSEKRENFLDEIDRNITDGNMQQAINNIKNAAIDNTGVDESKKIRGQERTVQFFNEIQDDLKAYEEAGGKTNIFKGTIENILAKAGETKNPELRKIATKIATAIQSYRRSMTGVAFSAPENEEYKKMFPSISKVGEFNSAVIDGLTEVFTGDLEYFYRKALGDKPYEELIKDDLLNVLDKTSRENPGEDGSNQEITGTEWQSESGNTYILPN